MRDRRAQILRLHARGIPAVEICVRLLVSWQAVARVIGEAEPVLALRQAQDEETTDSRASASEMVGGFPVAAAPASRGGNRRTSVYTRMGGRGTSRGADVTAGETAPSFDAAPLAGRRRREESRQHLVDRAVQDGRVTRCPPAYGAPVAGAAPTGPLPHYTPPEARPGGWRAKAAAAVAARRQRANG